MSFSAAETRRQIAGHDQSVITLTDDHAVAEFLPGLGCNCIRWQIGGLDLLYCPPLEELAERPTRGGIPVLFPFPNRIRDGYFVWGGHEYQLPKNDSSKQNAIHGYSPRKPWEMMNAGFDVMGAWLDAQFAIHDDWPDGGAVDLRIGLTPSILRYHAVVRGNSKPLPFGLGYHPYFAATPDCRVQTPARARWELVDGIPTGRRLPLEGEFDLRGPRPVGELTLDDVYTNLPDTPPGADGLIERGRVEYPGVGTLHVRTSRAFRELVLFTPPHRKAVCLEPYTCPTDAIHLQEREDVGWQVLPPGGRWEGIVEYVWKEEQRAE